MYTLILLVSCYIDLDSFFFSSSCYFCALFLFCVLQFSFKFVCVRFFIYFFTFDLRFAASSLMWILRLCLLQRLCHFLYTFCWFDSLHTILFSFAEVNDHSQFCSIYYSRNCCACWRKRPHKIRPTVSFESKVNSVRTGHIQRNRVNKLLFLILCNSNRYNIA